MFIYVDSLIISHAFQLLANVIFSCNFNNLSTSLWYYDHLSTPFSCLDYSSLLNSITYSEDCLTLFSKRLD